MGKRADEKKYIHNFARTLRGKVGVLPGFFEANKSAERICEIIIEGYGTKIQTSLTELSNETLGRIVGCGLSHDDYDNSAGTSLHQAMGTVGRNFFGNTMHSGSSHLHMIAFYAVVAAMADNILHDLRKPEHLLRQLGRGGDKASMLARKSGHAPVKPNWRDEM